ncbi:MAG: hypothetical protein ACT6RN_00005, partial [Agrobacterium sp.]|uniref:hypothetical protein n=1 Tax=Agrobacterium sp. TaxID=361 RepID=UPI004037B2DF
MAIDATTGTDWHFLPLRSRQLCCLIKGSAAATFDVAAADLVGAPSERSDLTVRSPSGWPSGASRLRSR